MVDWLLKYWKIGSWKDWNVGRCLGVVGIGRLEGWLLFWLFWKAGCWLLEGWFGRLEDWLLVLGSIGRLVFENWRLVVGRLEGWLVVVG